MTTRENNKRHYIWGAAQIITQSNLAGPSYLNIITGQQNTAVNGTSTSSHKVQRRKHQPFPQNKNTNRCSKAKTKQM